MIFENDQSEAEKYFYWLSEKTILFQKVSGKCFKEFKNNFNFKLKSSCYYTVRAIVQDSNLKSPESTIKYFLYCNMLLILENFIKVSFHSKIIFVTAINLK
ncbi:MAG: hypothetical protein M1326_10390 [Cyanobacteria bacterium]|nr:hypothetical protein [Cyanobacteriota bacterium]